MLEVVRSYIRNNQKWLKSEGPNSLRFCESFKIKNIDSADFAKLPKSPYIKLIFNDFEEEKLIGIDDINDLKEDYGKGYISSDEKFYVLIKIDKRIFNTKKISDVYFFSNIKSFIENIARLGWADATKKMQVYLLSEEKKINFESKFLLLINWSDQLDISSKHIEKNALERFSEFNDIYRYIYDEKKINTYFDYPIIWQNIVGEEDLYEINLLKLKSFLSIICSKKMNSNTFVIRGHKTISITVDDYKIDNSSSVKISDLFDFIVDKDKHQDKLIILRNTMTIFLNEQSITKDIVIQIEEILKSVNYNFELYVQDKVRLFLEQKNKLLQEFITTARKIEELTNQLIVQSRGVAISLLGTIFISILSSVKSAVSLSLINVVLLSYGCYFLFNAYLVFKQDKQKDNLINSLKKYTDKLGVIGNSSESNLSYSTLKKDFLKESINNFDNFRAKMIFTLLFIAGLFFILFLSVRFNLMPWIKILIKWIINY